MRVVAGAALALSVLGTALPSAAQRYPTKPIRIVSGFAPGGGIDIMARVLSPKLVEALGQQVIVESRPGDGTNIAMDHVVKSAPDGYTLLMNTPPVAINMSLYRKLPFDTTRDQPACTRCDPARDHREARRRDRESGAIAGSETAPDGRAWR